MVAVAMAIGLGAAAVSARSDDVRLVPHTTAIAYQKAFKNEKLAGWRKRAPATEVVSIPSSVDGTQQKAIWYHSGSTKPKPLLVVLHSWSATFRQNLDIPFAEAAIANDWAFIHPNFRGENKTPQATASDLAVQDVVDAVLFAGKRAAVDRARVYLVGYSGGAMKALVLAGRHPELWAGVAAWGTIHDIADWYRHPHDDTKTYRKQIAASCGGVPRPGSAAERECDERSPSSQVRPAAGEVPILIAHGLQDRTVPPRHAIDAFNTLAAPDDRFDGQQRAFIDTRHALPRDLPRSSSPDQSLADAFRRAGAPIRLHRQSRAATLVLYQGAHDMVYNASLIWLSRQRRQ
jgi:predicted esterase